MTVGKIERRGRIDGRQGVNFTNILRLAFFCTITLREAFLCLHFRFEYFMAQEYCSKYAHKMLVKLTQDVSNLQRHRGEKVEAEGCTRNQEYSRTSKAGLWSTVKPNVCSKSFLLYLL